jgi:hypothetical protein
MLYKESGERRDIYNIPPNYINRKGGKKEMRKNQRTTATIKFDSGKVAKFLKIAFSSVLFAIGVGVGVIIKKIQMG